MRPEPCFVCGSMDFKAVRQEGDAVAYRCGPCGNFFLTGTAISCIQTRLAAEPNLRPVLSHSFRKMTARTPGSPVGWDVVKQILDTASLPNPAQQTDNLILNLGEALTPMGPGWELMIGVPQQA